MVILILALFNSFSLAQVSAGAGSSETNLARAIALLGSTATGKAELESARQLHVPIVEGTVSKTEITATRQVQGSSENLKFTTQVLVAQDKDPVFQALDLAHELTHATHPTKNPFDPNLNATEYVRTGIEGEGGEAAAVAQECQVGKELVEQNKVKEEMAQLIKARCQYVWKTGSDQEKWNRSFYYLGQYYHQFMSSIRGMGGNFKSSFNGPMVVEAKSPMFSSAVAHKPYPMALLEEYVEITRTVCNRAKTNSLARKIASLGLLEQRCHGIEKESEN